ncbi:MAG: hypothetical protein JNK23_00965 [Opitutaceae bacterium]|nr:hypothetical protein [Opitutaceae bacterium]
MLRLLLLPALILMAVVSAGCFFSKKTPRAKEAPAIAADVEESFRKRWVDKRTAELAGQGTAAEAARAQAETEFRDRYGFTRAGQKK